ncbi:MAG: hypothetical protein KDB02_07740 [Acidimicrobiales bacterium]|nr:hypothetical protein [Acidimicrobiales bacterium]
MSGNFDWASGGNMRRFQVLFSVAVITLLLGACGGSDSSTSSTATTVAGVTTTTTDSAVAESRAKDLIPDAEFRQMCVNVKDQAALDVVVPACAYLASIKSHDGSKIPLADDAWRIEQGVNTGTTGAEIKQAMANDYFVNYVEDLRDVRWFVNSDDEAIAYYVLDIKAVPGIKSTMLAERFKVDDGLITEIEVVFAYCRVPVTNAAAPDGTDMCPKEASPPAPVA